MQSTVLRKEKRVKRRIKAAILSGTLFLMAALPGCVQREKVYYLPKEEYPQIERKERDDALPVEEETDDSDSVVLPFIPFETEETQ